MPFDYSLDFQAIDFRVRPDLYRIGRGEQGVLLVEPYKSEILPFWKFRTAKDAKVSARSIYALFLEFRRVQDFVGMDMARKFLQMGYTRARRYANHKSGKKYDKRTGTVLPRVEDAEKAAAAVVFKAWWMKAAANKRYQELKAKHRLAHEGAGS